MCNKIPAKLNKLKKFFADFESTAPDVKVKNSAHGSRDVAMVFVDLTQIKFFLVGITESDKKYDPDDFVKIIL